MRDPRRPLLEFVRESLGEFFSLDGRLLRTALALLVPGRLTRLYLEGRRASHMTPVRLYFVASLFFFFLIGFEAPDASRMNVMIDGVLIERTEPDPGLGNFNLGLSSDGWLERRIAPGAQQKIEALQQMPAQELLDRFFDGLERTVPTALIGFVPILAVALQLIFWRRRRFYVEHLVFAFHFQSFLFVALLLASLANALSLDRWIPGVLVYLSVFLILAPVYLVVAARRIYGESWLWTTVKCGLLSFLLLFLVQPLFLVTFTWIVDKM